MFVTKKQFLTW